MPESNSATLFERLGGMKVINRTVDTLYQRISMDSELSPFFQNICMARQRVKLKAFLAVISDGPKVYTGKNLRAAHTTSVQQGLNDTHMDKLLALLSAALLEQGSHSDDVDEVISIANSVRDDILNR